MRSLAILFLVVASHASAQPASAPRFRSGAEVVAIDVTVINDKGEPVADLTAGDFIVSVEGRPRTIQSAQFLKSDSTPRQPRPDESSNSDPTSGRLLLIVTDDGTLRMGSFPVVAAARALLDRLGPGDLVGVSHIPDGGGVAFTADRARVIDELAKLRPAKPLVRSGLTVYISEALDFDGQRRFQWPAALKRECGEEGALFRQCELNLEQTARALLIEESIQTNTTIRGLENLMMSLAPTGQPVTLVLLSESMVIARDPAALAGLAAACAEARVTLHVVQPAPQTAAMTSSGFPSDPVTDTQLREEGLRLMAAQARGEFHRAVSTGASTFERIGREVSGYYLLGIEPAAEDRREPRRRVDVAVRRPGLTVRARSMFALDGRTADSSADTSARLKRMLETTVPETGVPMRITARTVNGEAGQVRVLVAAEIGEATDQRKTFHVGLIAIDSEGAVKTRIAATTSLEPSRAHRQSPSLFTTSLLLDPGDYSVRIAAIDDTGRGGSVHHGVRAAMREWPRGIRTSDLIVANQPSASEFPPFNASSIVYTPGVAALLDVAHRDAAALDRITVRFDIDGDSVESRSASATNGVRSFASLIEPRTPGEHRLRAIITVPDAADVVLERSFSYEPVVPDQLDPKMIRSFIEALEQRAPVSPALTAFVSQAREGRFVAPPDAETRPDGDLAMVTFVQGLAALRDNKPAVAKVLFQQTLRKAPGFEGALFYLAQIK